MLYSPIHIRVNHKDDQWDRMTRIAIKETGRRMRRKGAAGEVSEFQLMPITIKSYNRLHKTAYTVEQVGRSKILSRMIADWSIQWHMWRYREECAALRLVLSVSAYNTGYKLADRHVIRWTYVRDIEPDALDAVERLYKVRKGSEFMLVGDRL